MVQRIIGWMRTMPLAEIMKQPEIQAQYAPLYERHLRSIGIIGDKSTHDSGVIFFDLAGTGLEGYNKFIPYYYHPEVTYVVSLSQSSYRTKISVGSNPWAPRPRTHNIAEICERYGGGGHAVVGAVSLAPDELDLGRKYTQEIIEELRFAD